MADGTISIDVELNETAFKSSLENMGAIVKTSTELMVKSVNGLSGSFVLLPNTITSVCNSVPNIINGVINSITGKNPDMTRAGTDFFTSFVGEIPAVIDRISGSITEINDSVVNKFNDFMPDITDTGKDFFTSLISNLSGIIEDITEAVPEITEKIAETIENGSPLLSETGFDLFRSIVNPLPEAITEIIKAPEEIMSALAVKFHSLTGQFKDVGKNIVYGVWSGISSMASWLSSQVTGFFQGLVGSVTGFLGIKSPSRLFRDLVGKNIALGVQAGINAEMTGVISDTKTQMSRLANASFQSMKLNPRAADIIGRSNTADASELHGILKTRFENEPVGSTAAPEINVTLEPTGDIRGFFDYISMGVKRTDYLNGTN
ncbi:MAG: hypothetical protein FWD23_18955 [Oscillospiraceae bacterium]|nr:hypothetical protein [Oscillospiraceae bacterium]